MQNFYDLNYELGVDSGTSGAEVSDLRPEKAYDTDLRRVDVDDRQAAESVNNKQNRVAKYMRAAKSAGAYRLRAGIAEPTIKGRTPRTPATIDGTELPTLGDSGGRSGTVGYARRPQPQFGKPF